VAQTKENKQFKTLQKSTKPPTKQPTKQKSPKNQNKAYQKIKMEKTTKQEKQRTNLSGL
jgi:hypothetical protein